MDQYAADVQALLWCAQSGVQQWQRRLQRAGLLWDVPQPNQTVVAPAWAQALRSQVRSRGCCLQHGSCGA
jgi:hypothetical protein